MGLDTSHNAWHGAYSAFMRWRTGIARVAGIPLELMEGFYSNDSSQMQLATRAYQRDQIGLGIVDTIKRVCPISWDALKPDPLHILLHHSDCDGEIAPEHCAAIADRLEEILPSLPDDDGGGHIGNWREKTQSFIDGCRAAAAANEPLDFH